MIGPVVDTPENRGMRKAVAFMAIVAAAMPSVWAGERGPGLKVVASFYPLYIATLNVACGVPGVDVANMTPSFAGCLHDYSLTPDDRATLAGADVFVVNGAGMENFLDKAVRQAPRMKVITSSDGVDFIRRDGEPNPHIWLSVTRHIRQVRNIADGLAKADPPHAEAYRRNADAYAVKLRKMKEEIEAGLKDVPLRDIVTFHEAFPYFAEEFGLRVAAVIERDPGDDPSAREMAETIGVVRRLGIKAIFTEPQYPAKAAETIARETGARVCLLDPAVTGPADRDAFLDIMRRNLATLRKALK